MLLSEKRKRNIITTANKAPVLLALIRNNSGESSGDFPMRGFLNVLGFEM